VTASLEEALIRSGGRSGIYTQKQNGAKGVVGSLPMNEGQHHRLSAQAQPLWGFLKRKLLALTTAAVCSGSLGATELPEAPGTQIWISDRRLHLNCSGRGVPTVVLESGLGGTSLEWREIQQSLSGLTRVCSYDRAGYGWSDPAYNPRTALNAAKDLEKLLGYGSVRAPYVMVGHSFGGLTTRVFATRNPERVAGLVLVDSTHESQFEEFAKAGIGNVFAPRDRQFQIRNFSMVPEGLPPPVRDLAGQMAKRASTVITLYSELRNMRLSARQAGTSTALPNVPLAVLAHDAVAQAQSDAALKTAQVWMRMQGELARRSPQGYLRVAANSGHHIHLDEPGLVIDAIADVVATVRAASP